MVTMNADHHITDGELVGLLDGEAGAGRREVEAHVDTCPVCTARLAQLQQRSTQFSKRLGAVDLPLVDRARLFPPPAQVAHARHRGPRRLWSHVGFRAAAGVLLVAGIAAASPARGWILDRVMGRRSLVTPGERRSPTLAPARIPAQGSGSIVRFGAESDELLVRFAVTPAAGTLTVVGGTDSLSSAQIISDAHGEGFLVLPNELRVRNDSDSRAGYQMILAPAIRRVLVQIGDVGSRQATSVQVAPGVRHVIQLGSAGEGR